MTPLPGKSFWSICYSRKDGTAYRSFHLKQQYDVNSSFTHNIFDSGKKYISKKIQIDSQGTEKASSQVTQNGDNNIEFNFLGPRVYAPNYLLYWVLSLH